MSSSPSRIPVPLFALDPERARTATRTAVASVVSLCIVLIYRFPEGYWALITCLVMTQASVGASIDKGILRLVGTVVACMLAVVWLAPLNQSPVAFLVVTFVIITIAAYLGSGSVYPYAFVIGGVTLVMVAVLGFEGQNVAASKGLARSGEILVGVLVSWFCAFAIWPRRASDQIDQIVDRTIARTRAAFEAAVAAILEGRPPPPRLRDELAEVEPDLHTMLALVPAAAREGRAHRRRTQARRRLAIHLERLRATLLPLADPIGALPNGLVDATKNELSAVLEAIRGAWRILERPSEDGEVDRALDAIRPRRHALERRLDELRRSGATHRLSARDVVGFHGILGTLREVETQLHAVSRCGDTLDDDTDTSWRQLLEAFSIDEPRRRYAIKTGLAVCFAIALLNVLQWESSVSAMITVFIVSQLSIGGSVRKAMLRLSGAFFGGFLALIAILVLTPHISTLPPFAVAIFVVMFGCAYAYTGPESSSYAGLQTGLAFVIVLVAGPKQETSIMPGVYRLVGVMLGTAISIAVETVLWPSHAYVDLRDRIRDSLVGAGTLFRSLSSALRGAPPARDEWLRRAHVARQRLTGFWQILGEALLEGKEARAAVAFELPVATATDEMMHRIARLAVRIDRPVNPELRALVEPALDELLDRVEGTLDRLPAYLDGAHPPAEASADGDALRAANLRLLDAVETARGDRRTLALPEAEVSFFFGLLDAVVRIAQGISVTCGALSRAPQT